MTKTNGVIRPNVVCTRAVYYQNSAP